MCGIGGIVRLTDPPAGGVTDDLPARLKAMLRQLGHRGPDGQGQANLGRCTLVHTRLAILDQPGGHQPMRLDMPGESQAGASLCVVFNGEIYNHRALRQQLESVGHRFITDHSDTEVLLHGYRQWGAGLTDRLQGMFALAVWDGRSQSLLLARDRMGEKPLWFTHGDGELVFGSHPATILAARPHHNARPAINPAAMAMFLRLGYTGHAALIEGIHELPPAHRATLDAAGRWRVERYWQPGDDADAPGQGIARTRTSLSDALAQVRQAISQAVADRLQADVPLGCFLSGGIDSSLLAAMAQRHLAAWGQPPLQTFCARMPDSAYDESDAARSVADHLGTTHRELLIEPDPRKLIGDLATLIAQCGEPMADSSLLASHAISQAAREHVTVALAGDGGDECFAGYDRYRAMALLASHRAWLRWLPVAGLRSMRARGWRARLGRLRDAAQWRLPAEQYQQMIHLFTLDQMHALGVADTGEQALPGWPAQGDIPPLRQAMRWDAAHYLPMNLLRKADRASMAVALEVRCPLLDAHVVSLAHRLSTATLMPGGRPKGLLRLLAAELLPRAITRRPKRGFALPMGAWLRGPLRDTLADHLQSDALAALGLRSAVAMTLFDQHQRGQADHTHRLYALLTLAIWSHWLRRH